MIGAHELRDIAKLSDASVEKALESLDRRLREEAESGRYVFNWSSESVTVPFYGYARPPEYTTFQGRLMEKLKTLGFKVQWCMFGQPRKPAIGLGGGEDPDGQEMATYGIQISWA